MRVGLGGAEDVFVGRFGLTGFFDDDDEEACLGFCFVFKVFDVFEFCVFEDEDDVLGFVLEELDADGFLGGLVGFVAEVVSARSSFSCSSFFRFFSNSSLVSRSARCRASSLRFSK